MIRRIAAGLLALALAGCGGARVRVAPMIDEFDRYERDTMALSPLPPASDALKMGQARRDEARPIVEKGGDWEAYPTMDEALADARFALAAARSDQAQTRADECRRTVERARQDWQETILMLEQTERVAQRTASDIPRDEPDAADSAAAAFPPSNLDGKKPATGTPQELQASFKAWIDAAESRSISVADVASRFSDRLSQSTAEKTRDKDRPRHAYVAGRALQELEARVREESALQVCVSSTALAAKFGDLREQALRATIDLERGLKDDLRTELEKTRTEARERQQDLYDSLKKLEGRFFTLTQTARGTIVSLADILFDFNKATLKRDVEFNLVKIATILGQFPEMKIAVEGHTDNVGSEQYNLDLSKKRAQAVFDFLSSQGVDASRMTVAGYGFSRPVADNSSEAGRQKNRRVDLVINDKP